MIRAVLFDLDNTLIDDDASTRRAIAAACEEAATQCPNLSVAQLGEAYWNVSLEVWGAIAADLGKGLSPKEITGAEFRRVCWSRSLAACGVADEAVVTRVVESYGHWRDKELEPFPEVEEVLAALHGRVKVAIITNGTADTHRHKLELLGYHQLFDYCAVAGELGLAKPHPAIFTHTAEKLGVQPEECLMIGDNAEADIAGAKAAGMRAAWFNREGWPLPEGCPEPDYVIADLREIVGIVEGQ
jgi:putative hydrolase of the HAD superfamily